MIVAMMVNHPHAKATFILIVAALFSSSLSVRWAFSLSNEASGRLADVGDSIFGTNTSSPQSPLLLKTLLYAAWDNLPERNVEGEKYEADKAEPQIPNQVLANLIYPTEPIPEDDVVMITHTSVGSRLSNLLIQLRWWNGPAAVSVYMKSKDEIDTFLNDLVPQLAAANLTKQLQVHAVVEKTALPYPHNLLRNVALDHLRSDYFLAMDADFITSPNAHERLLELTKPNTTLRQLLHKQHLFVLPAYERKAPSGLDSPAEDLLPRSKRDLLRMQTRKQVLSFHARIWSQGHEATDFDRWERNRNNSEVFYRIKYSFYFEPYVLGYRHAMPRYWKGFRGFNFNKFSWFAELDRLRFRFCVLNNLFVVHINHPIARDLGFKKGSHDQYLKFTKYKRDRYGPVLQKDEPSIEPEERKVVFRTWGIRSKSRRSEVSSG